MYPLKQSTATTVPFFVHDAAGDPVTGLTDGSFTKRISKNGAAFGAMTVTITEMENGWYSIPLSASHSDTLGLLTVVFTNAGAEQVNLQFRVHARLPDDLAYPATSGRSLQVETDGHVHADLKEWLGTAPLALAAQRVVSDVGAVSGDSGAADNLEADYDGAGYSKSASTVGTVTTLTGHTPQTGDSFARLGAPAGVSVSADIAENQADLNTLLGRVTAALFAGITSLADWLAALAGPHGDATAVAEINAAGDGGGSYADADDSQQAIRDRGDAEWITATGFATPGAAMDLVTDAVDADAVATTGANEIRDALIDDATRFSGADIDAAVSTRSSHSAADVDTTLSGTHGAGSWATATGFPTGELLHTGTAQAGGALSITLAAGAHSVTDDFYKRARVTIVSGLGAGQERTITLYLAATRIATVDEAWVVNPDNTSVYEVTPGRTNSVAEDNLDVASSTLQTLINTRASQTTADAIETDTQDIQSTLGTPAGASIAADIAAAQAVLDGLNDVSTADLAAAIAADPGLIRVIQRTTNRVSLNPADGVVTVYNDAGASALTGLAYSDIGETTLYDGTAPVVSVTRLT